MLIGIPPLLSPDALHALRSMGHGDEVALVDRNYPALEHGRRLVRADGSSLIEVLSALLALLPLDRAVPVAILRTGENNAPDQLAPIHHDIDAACARLAPGFQVRPLAGADFYPRVRNAFCVIATGERSLFANVILRKGVIHPDSRA
ncbi:FucU Fucose dissimilation pathway protein FucU [Paracoccaceae bacterium]|jgi:L-fucose mutarotase